MTGAELINTERHRQLDEEGYSAEHDNENNKGELAFAAIAYLFATQSDRVAHDDGCVYFSKATSYWPWDPCLLKPKDRIANLVRAGALIAAEIDRLQRLQNLIQEFQVNENP